MWQQKLMWIAWPAFLMAGVLEFVVFAMVDPADLHWVGGAAMHLSRQAIYTVTFFVFWLIIMAAGFLTTLLAMSPFELNQCTMSADERPPQCCK